MTRARLLLVAGCAALSIACDAMTTLPGGQSGPPPTSGVASIYIAPNIGELEAGGAFSIAAAVLDGKGQTLAGRTVTWSSSNPSVASVVSTGSATAQVTARGLGKVTITAAAEGRAAELSFVVRGNSAFIYTQADGIEAIPMPDGVQQSRAFAINDAGDVVGTMRIGGVDRPFLWSRTSGAIDLLGNRAPALYGMATAINNAGEVAGWAFDASGIVSAFKWSAAGGLVSLGLPPDGLHSFATAINDSGVVVGSVWRRNLPNAAFRWSKSRGMELLVAPGGQGARANAINDGGVVVGAFVTGDAYNEEDSGGVLWNSGGDVAPFTTCTCYSAAAINRSGQIVGTTRDGHPFRWTSTSGLVSLSASGAATAINAGGDVVGVVDYAMGVIWRQGGLLVELPLLLGRTPTPTGINSSGTVVGTVR